MRVLPLIELTKTQHRGVACRMWDQMEKYPLCYYIGLQSFRILIGVMFTGFLYSSSLYCLQYFSFENYYYSFNDLCIHQLFILVFGF